MNFFQSFLSSYNFSYSKVLWSVKLCGLVVFGLVWGMTGVFLGGGQGGEKEDRDDAGKTLLLCVSTRCSDFPQCITEMLYNCHLSFTHVNNSTL